MLKDFQSLICSASYDWNCLFCGCHDKPIDFVTFLKAAIESPMHVDEITPLKEEEGSEAEVKEESEEKPIVNQVNSAPVS